MVFVPAVPPARDEAGDFEHRKVLRDCLSRQPNFVLHRQASAQLVKRLPVPFAQLVDDRTPNRGGERVEHVIH